MIFVQGLKTFLIFEWARESWAIRVSSMYLGSLPLSMQDLHTCSLTLERLLLKHRNGSSGAFINSH